MNTREIQGMTAELGKTAVAYGMSQEKMFDVASTLAESLKMSTVFGKGQTTTEAFAEIGASLGDRLTSELSVVGEFLTGVGQESAALFAGVINNQNKFLMASKEEQKMLIKDTVNTYMRTFEAQTRGIAPTSGGKRQVQNVIERMGGMQVFEAMRATQKGFEDAVTATKENTQGLFSLKSMEEKYIQSIEKSAAALTIISENIPRTAAQNVAGVAGTLATGAGIAGLATNIGTKIAQSRGVAAALTRVAPGLAARIAARAAAGAAIGSVLPGIGTLIGAVGGVATAVWAGAEILDAMKPDIKATADQTANIPPKPTTTAPDPQRPIGILDSLNMMVKSLTPQVDTTNKAGVDVQKQALGVLTQINDNLSNMRRDQPLAMKLKY